MSQTSLDLTRAFEPHYGEGVCIAPGILRVTARNPGPFTFLGTNSYLIGHEKLLLVDPGPDLDEHFETIRRVVGARPVEAVVLTHTHRDHTALVPRIRAAFDAPVWAEGPHRASRPLRPGEETALDASGDMELSVDRRLADGERIATDAGDLEVVATPGHAANHLAFALATGPAKGILLSGDHVMAWSTTVVAPPDGAMADYMASLDRLMTREDTLFLPGHGGPVRRPRPFLRAMKAHRLMREAAIAQAVADGLDRIPDIVARLYRDTDPKLHRAAGLSVLAHLEDLVRRGLVFSDGPPAPDSRFRPG